MPTRQRHLFLEGRFSLTFNNTIKCNAHVHVTKDEHGNKTPESLEKDTLLFTS